MTQMDQPASSGDLDQVEPYQIEEPQCIAASVISGIGETEVLQTVSDTVQGVELADLIIFPQRACLVDCEVSTNKVIVYGTVKIIGVAFGETRTFGTLQAGCTGGFTEQAALFSFACPFAVGVPVPGACPGDKWSVELCVEATTHTIDVTGSGEGVTSEVDITAIIRVRVTTTRQTMVTVTPVANLCPEFPATSSCPTGT